MKLSEVSILAWLNENQIKTETGLPIDIKSHLFLFEPYRDLSPKQAILKAAQIGFSTLAILKSFWVAKHRGMDIIYTLPTEKDVQEFVGGKVNRIVAQNPILQHYTKDKDSVEQKQVGHNLIYYRGTWTQKAAIMVSSDLNIYDEVDASKQDVIEQYSTRLQHSKHKWEWYFSHPSAQGTGVDRYWERSDKKHWFITPPCGHEQYLSWPENVDDKRVVFQCKVCKAELTDEDRRKGRWKKTADGEYSGYWIPLLIAPWVTAKEILDYHKFKSEEYFYNKVLGLPYVGGGNKLTKAALMRNLTKEILTPERGERVVIGVDTGKQLHFVAGTERGIFYYGEAKGYEEIERLFERWPRSIAVIDQGGDITAPRALRERYPGRVFLCTYGEDRKTKELFRWGRRDEDGAVVADRNRTIQLLVDEFTDARIPIQGTENDWYDYWLHWNNLTRTKEYDEKSGAFRRYIWVRNGDDHFAHATVYWRVGISRFSNTAQIFGSVADIPVNGIELSPLNQVVIKDMQIIHNASHDDWRKT